MIRKTFSALAVVLALAGAACTTIPATDTAPARREIDIHKVRAASATITDILTMAGEGALAMSRWSDAEREDIRKALAALKIANDELQKPVDGVVDVRALGNGVLNVAGQLVPLLDLEPDAKIMVNVGLAIMRGALLMLPPKPVVS